MPLEFLSSRFNYRAVSRSIVVAAICNGRLVDVVIPRMVLERVSGRASLSQDECVSVATQNLETLRRAAWMAAARNGAHVAVAVIEPSDIAAVGSLEEEAIA